MSTNPMPLSIDLNIDRMRAKIYQELTDVCKPYYKRLEQLDNVEAFLKAEMGSTPEAKNGLSPQKRGWLKRKRHQAKIVREEKTPAKLLPAAQSHRAPSGDTAGIYADLSQRTALVDAVGKEPGMTVAEVTERLVAGGYPFKGGTPLEAMYVALRSAVKAGHILQVTPDTPGEYIRYYPIDQSPPAAQSHRAPEPRAIRGKLATAIVGVIASGSKFGMTRKEVLEALLETGYTFDPGTAYPQRNVTWSLQSQVDGGRIQRSGEGAGALFSAPKITAVKHK